MVPGPVSCGGREALGASVLPLYLPPQSCSEAPPGWSGGEEKDEDFLGDSGCADPVQRQVGDRWLLCSQGAHMAMVDALMMAYTVGMISIEKVVASVKRFSTFSASKELPYDLEDAMVFWINKVSAPCSGSREAQAKVGAARADVLVLSSGRKRRERGDAWTVDSAGLSGVVGISTFCLYLKPQCVLKKPLVLVGILMMRKRVSSSVPFALLRSLQWGSLYTV